MEVLCSRHALERGWLSARKWLIGFDDSARVGLGNSLNFPNRCLGRRPAGILGPISSPPVISEYQCLFPYIPLKLPPEGGEGATCDTQLTFGPPYPSHCPGSPISGDRAKNAGGTDHRVTGTLSFCVTDDSHTYKAHFTSVNECRPWWNDKIRMSHYTDVCT